MPEPTTSLAQLRLNVAPALTEAVYLARRVQEEASNYPKVARLRVALDEANVAVAHLRNAERHIEILQGIRNPSTS